MGTVWDAPNQQVVREDESAPWEEGTGGDVVERESREDLAAMTKAELLAEAEARDVEADDSMTKAQIVEALEGSE